MKITFLGHAGLYLETKYGNVLCDPWTNPAYFDSWFVFPENSWLDWDHFGRADYLYVSHMHQDHFDPILLSHHVSRDATVLLPDFELHDLRTELERLGFTRFCVMPSGRAVEHRSLRLMAQVIHSPTEGGLGDSLLAVDDGTACVLNQNDARPTNLTPILNFGSFDVHFLQFSGAIWWPWTYDLPEEAQRSFGGAKRINGLDRAAQYAKLIGARNIVPFAGPACFLDEELFALNDLTQDSSNTFPDQTVFLEYLHLKGVSGGRLLIPGAMLELDNHACQVHWPDEIYQGPHPFKDKSRYLNRYAARMRSKIKANKARWPAAGLDVLAELKLWFEPLLELAHHIRAGVGGPVLLWVGSELQVVIDFPTAQVRPYDGETCRYQFTIARPLVERLIADHRVDWVNSLFLSMRFQARRIGPYNEYLYTFFACLALDRLMYAEAWYADKDNDDDDVRLGDWIVQRHCPHLQGDLGQFGKTEGTILTCTVHGWQFDLVTGRCLTSDADIYSLRRAFVPK